ncbi:MAG TPA: hypothetical protein VM933_06035 [Acidimicrobiales bacterium]|nr:hypothetical protein [Acidimicrobiales bacterium]
MAVAGTVLAGWLLATVVRHGDDEVYDLPAWAVALGVAAALAGIVGWALVIRSRGWLGVGVAVLGAVIVTSVVVLPILGMLLFVGGIVAMARTAQGRPDRSALTGGLLVAVGLPLAAVVAADGPVVECHADGNGVTTSSSLFRSSSSGTGSGTSDGDGVLESGGRRYTYRCEGGVLVHFSRSGRAERP